MGLGSVPDRMEADMTKWRMPSPCENCPFNETGPGRVLRDGLRPGRFDEILDSLEAGQSFTCHKTVDDEGHGEKLMCAGAIAWQEENGCVSQMQRWMERIEYFSEHNQLK